MRKFPDHWSEKLREAHRKAQRSNVTLMAVGILLILVGFACFFIFHEVGFIALASPGVLAVLTGASLYSFQCDKLEEEK